MEHLTREKTREAGSSYLEYFSIQKGLMFIVDKLQSAKKTRKNLEDVM